MLDWITHLFNSSDRGAEPGVVDQALLFHLREQLNECEAIYRAGAHLCRQVCPETIEGEPAKFLDLMLDLHRGLLIKVFVEISDCERCWHKEECELALELLYHVWGVNIEKEDLMQVLHNVAELDKTLQWENVLGPFIRIPALADQAAELKTCVMRISNLITKADGKILPSEAGRLRSLQATMERTLGPRSASATVDSPSAARAGAHAAQRVRTRLPGRAPANQGHRSPAARAEKTPPKEPESPEKMLAEAMIELNRLIGLDVLKTDIRELVNFLKVEKERRLRDLPQTQISLHTVFLGNPGTGKTTVARLLARILAGLCILRRGHTVETDRAGLVAEYAGQTGPKVNERVDESLDGLLFIDEAYSLVAQSGDDPYGCEAVQVLLKRMEDDRDRLVVVLAGYPQPMEHMLNSNPGLRSRFQRTFRFPDYNADELSQIFLAMCKKGQYVLTEGARDKLRALFQRQFDLRDETFGNGRLARNLFEHAIGKMANRIVEVAPITRPLLTTLEAEDIQLHGPSPGSRAEGEQP